MRPLALALLLFAATERAPAVYRVQFETTKGSFVVQVTRKWAPRGADRFYGLVKNGYYDDTAFFRVVGGFMAQIGIHGRPEVSAVWRNQKLQDDPHWRDLILFHEYFNGDSGEGLGASHQTGWTGLVAKLIHQVGS